MKTNTNKAAKNKSEFVLKGVKLCCNLSLTLLKFLSHCWKHPKPLASNCKQHRD